MDDLKTIIRNLAKEAVESYVKNEIILDYVPQHPFLKQKAGAFVSLKITEQLRGCLGSIEPQKENLAAEIINNAIKACSQDYRFNPVLEQELEKLSYSIDVLSRPQKINSINELDSKKYGVIVRQQLATGLLLPDLEGIDTAEKQLDIAKRKAGIIDNNDLKIFRFEVKRF